VDECKPLLRGLAALEAQRAAHAAEMAEARRECAEEAGPAGICFLAQIPYALFTKFRLLCSDYTQ
jgi:hypothetical protein